MKDSTVLKWLDNVAIEVSARLGEANPQDIAKALGIPARDMNRLCNGSSEADPRVVKTEYYAAVFYHYGVMAADPRGIPVSKGRSRPWTEAEYQAWKKNQPEPMFVDQSEAIASAIRELTGKLRGVILSTGGDNARVLASLRTTHSDSVANLVEALDVILNHTDGSAYEMAVRSWWEGLNDQ